MGHVGRRPSRSCGVLGDVDGLDVVELGCGTAYFSAWLARRGARPVGVDITPAQLETARRMQRETGLEFPLVEADAGATGLPDASFDLALSEYGASIWVDPYRWIPEAARLLRPGGRLVFLRNSTLAVLCYARRRGRAVDGPAAAPAARHAPARVAGRRRRVPSRPRRVIDVLRANGFEVERLVGAPGAGRGRARASVTTSARRSSGRGAGRPRRSGSPGSDERLPAPPLLLASTSPQRRAILDAARGSRSTSSPPDHHEAPGGDPARARGRARRARSTAASGPCSASTRVVVCDGELIGKPREDAGEAGRMLERSRGGRTRSSPASACARPRGRSSARETTLVTFRTLTPRELAHYVARGEWEGRAGAYAIQGLGASLVERIEGDYLNVVGLPGALLVRLLAERFPGDVRVRLDARRQRDAAEDEDRAGDAAASRPARPAAGPRGACDHDRRRAHREHGRGGAVAEREQAERERADVRDGGDRGGQGQLRSDRARGRRAAGTRGTARRARARSRSARRRAGCRRGRRACRRRSRRRSSPPRAERAGVAVAALTADEHDPGGHDEHAGRLGRRRAPCPSSATDAISVSTGARPRVSG